MGCESLDKCTGSVPGVWSKTCNRGGEFWYGFKGKSPKNYFIISTSCRTKMKIAAKITFGGWILW